MLRYRTAGRDVKVTLRGTRREAEAELTRLLRERDAGGGRRVTSKETFAAYATRWLESRKQRVEPGTIEAYQKHLDIRREGHVANDFGKQVQWGLHHQVCCQLDRR